MVDDHPPSGSLLGCGLIAVPHAVGQAGLDRRQDLIYEVIGNIREKIRRLPRLDDRHLVAIWVISRPVTEIDADQLVPIGVRCRRGNIDLGRIHPHQGATLTFRDIEFLRLFDIHRRERIDQPGAAAKAPPPRARLLLPGSAGPLLTWCSASTAQFSTIAMPAMIPITKSMALLSFSSTPWLLTNGSIDTISMPSRRIVSLKTVARRSAGLASISRSEKHTSELQSPDHL